MVDGIEMICLCREGRGRGGDWGSSSCIKGGGKGHVRA